MNRTAKPGPDWRNLLAATLLLTGSATLAANDPLRAAIDTRIDNNRQERQTQTRIEKLSDERRRMLETYRQLERELESLSLYNDQLQRLVNAQQQELGSLQAQMESLEATRREIVPLMLRMVAALQTFIATDHPFLPEERQRRVTQLRKLMDRADISAGEKYRRVLEAYQIEMAYGRSIEAYRGELPADDGPQTVDFLRIGRVGLYYQTLDRRQVGQWDTRAKRWQKLPEHYGPAIRKGLRIARKQAAPELLALPLPAAQEATP